MPVTLNTIPASADEAVPLIKPKRSNQNDSGTPNECIAPGPGGYLNDILTATNETAIALATKGMDVRYVYGLDACHTDPRVQLEQRVPALIWAMAPWKEKLAAKKSA